MDTYALSRMQNQHGAWYWGVHFKRRGKPYLRRFYETKYDGNAPARKAARAWRDEQLAQLATFSKLEFCQQQRSNNTSGVPGVHFLTSDKQPLGFWQARLKLAGRRAINKSFSVRQYSSRVADEMAVAARQEMLAREKDEPYLHAAVARQKSKSAPSGSVSAAR